MIFQGMWTSIVKKPFIFVIFQGGGGSGPPAPPIDPRIRWSFCCLFTIYFCSHFAPIVRWVFVLGPCFVIWHLVSFSSFQFILIGKREPCADPAGRQGVGTPLLKNRKIIGLLSNTSLGPLKNHKATSKCWAFRWWANACPPFVLFGSYLPLSLHHKKHR